MQANEQITAAVGRCFYAPLPITSACPDWTAGLDDVSEVGDDIHQGDDGGRNRFLPFLIHRSDSGRVEILEPARHLSTPDQRRLATLLYEEGCKLHSQAEAVRWREFIAGGSAQEVTRVERILHPAWRASQEANKLRRQIRREQRKPIAVTDAWRPLEWEKKLADLDERSSPLRLATQRELVLLEVLKRVDHLHQRGNGLQAKAARHLVCGIYGHRMYGLTCRKRAIQPFHCKIRYCRQDAHAIFDELFGKYMALEGFVGEVTSRHADWRLRILDLTTRTVGTAMPGPEKIHRFKLCVKELKGRIVAYIQQEIERGWLGGLTAAEYLDRCRAAIDADDVGQKRERRADLRKRIASLVKEAQHDARDFGYIYCLEFGFENNNLHAHGAIVSPFLPQELLSAWWREITTEDGTFPDSFIVHIALADSFPSALAHALEYTGKFAACTPERAAALEVAFHGCRRVECLGSFYNNPHIQRAEKAKDIPCCLCNQPGCVLVRDEGRGYELVHLAVAAGIPNLDDVEPATPLNGRQVAEAILTPVKAMAP